MASASSSSGFEPKSARKYDVFISFRGEDTRLDFTSHLHAALKKDFIVAFRDDKKLEKGDEIASSLIQAIKDSSVSLIVFSQDYASSKWCLDELAQIMKYRKEGGQFVIPIFYKVDPSHVRKQAEDYGKAFEKHEIDFKHDPNRVNGWRSALLEAGNISGRHCIQTVTDESNLIEEIVADVKTKLKHIYKSQCASKGLIGIDELIEPIEILLEKSHKVGIWGMGGVGKTTMAKEVFGKLSSKYSSRSFLENVREKILRNRFECVRKLLVSELLREDMQSISSNALNDEEYVTRRLCSTKALVVLDDVNNSEQLMDMQENICNCLAEGSKVIITTRDQQLLKANDYEIHEAKALGYDNACQLFINKAFGQGDSKDGYDHLIEKFVHYTQRIPLALKVLGSCVGSKDKQFWNSLLKKLRDGGPNSEILEVLRVSYNGLEDEQKQIFLDIACFLKGESKEFVKELLESYGFHPTEGIETLKDKALIILINEKVEMHDLIQELGYRIVREENIKEHGKRSRLWDPNEICNVLKNCKGKNVEGIMLDFSEIKGLKLAAETFNNMKKLRFLKIHAPSYMSASSNIIISTTGLDSISSEIRYFHWQSYPGKSLPSNFCGELLHELNLTRSLIEMLWEGVQNLVNLKNISFQGSKQLMELPDFSMAQNLEGVDLKRCESLSHLHPYLLSLPILNKVILAYCKSLKSLKIESQSKSISNLYVHACYSLKEFSFSSDKITCLHLGYSGLEILDSSMGRMEKLPKLHLNGLTIKSLPINDICCMRSLQHLYLYECGELIDKSKRHTLFDSLQSLQSISLVEACKLTELPNNFKHLSRLQSLHMCDCKDLQSLPELPPSIEYLSARNWTSLKTLQLTSHIQSSLLADDLPELTLSGCQPLCELPKSIGPLSSLYKLDLSGSNVESLPDNIKHLSKLCFIDLTNCRRLCSLPELPPFVHSVDASGCISLKIVPTLIASVPKLRHLFLEDCLKLDDYSLSHVMKWA